MRHGASGSEEARSLHRRRSRVTGPGSTRCIGVDALVQCPRCQGSIPLAGPVLHARCHRCGAEVAVAQQLWMQTLGEVDERSFDAGTTRTSAGACRREQDGVHLSLEWARQEPACRRCGASVPQVEPGSGGETVCAACQAGMPTFPAPPWLRSELPTALQVYGVEYVLDAAALDTDARRWWVAFLGTPPRKAAAQQMFIEQEIVVMSRQNPVKSGSRAYMLPLLLAFALIALATYYVAAGVRQSSGDELLEISE